MKFRVEFEALTDDYAASLRSVGFLPFVLRAMPDVENPSFTVMFRVHCADLDLQYDALCHELGREKTLRASIRWFVVQVEERLRSGHITAESARTRPSENLRLTEGDLALLRRMASEKTCEYQVRPGRDLFCAAAAPSDEMFVGTRGLQKLARTSRPICNQCNMPDTDFVCSHLSHPQVRGVEFSSRAMFWALCENGRSEITLPWRCYPGGNPCWQRIVEPLPEPAPAAPFSPRELAVALDFLGAVWKQAFSHPLVRLRSVEKTAALSLPCATQDEFKSRLGDLNELFKLMEIPEHVLPPAQRGQIDPQQTFRRMLACLQEKIQDTAERENVAPAMDDLRAINEVRNKLTHDGSELAEALHRLGIEYPIRDYAQAWNQVRSKAAAALTTIRSALEGTL
jgi:hypothetical protein